MDQGKASLAIGTGLARQSASKVVLTRLLVTLRDVQLLRRLRLNCPLLFLSSLLDHPRTVYWRHNPTLFWHLLIRCFPTGRMYVFSSHNFSLRDIHSIVQSLSQQLNLSTILILCNSKWKSSFRNTFVQLR